MHSPIATHDDFLSNTGDHCCRNGNSSLDQGDTQQRSRSAESRKAWHLQITNGFAMPKERHPQKGCEGINATLVALPCKGWCSQGKLFMGDSWQVTRSSADGRLPLSVSPTRRGLLWFPFRQQALAYFVCQLLLPHGTSTGWIYHLSILVAYPTPASAHQMMS